MKQWIKKLLSLLPFHLTKNLRYDAETKMVIRKLCRENSNCIDVGCHKGEILDLMIRFAPQGRHYGFEPIPELFENLKRKYSHSSCIISDIALSNTSGTTSFNYVVSNPSYSGIKKRNYDRSGEVDTTIEVRTERMDQIIDPNLKIDLIKIDVEGAEMLVLEGAEQIIAHSRPVIIFEFGLGASDVYGTTPEKIFQFFSERNYQLSLLGAFLRNKGTFSLEELKNQYHQKINHYFIAFPSAG